jgi:hypothetical protein
VPSKSPERVAAGRAASAPGIFGAWLFSARPMKLSKAASQPSARKLRSRWDEGLARAMPSISAPTRLTCRMLLSKPTTQ